MNARAANKYHQIPVKWVVDIHQSKYAGVDQWTAHSSQENAPLPVLLYAPADGSPESLLYQALRQLVQSFPASTRLVLSPHVGKHGAYKEEQSNTS